MLRVGNAPQPPPQGPPPPPQGGPAGPPAGGPPPELLAALAAAHGVPGPAGGAPPPPDPSAAPENDPSASPTGGRTPKFDAEKVSPDVARYLTGDSRCKSCSFFSSQDSSCHVVGGPIDPEGVCSLWTGQGGKDNVDDGPDPSGSEADSPDETQVDG